MKMTQRQFNSLVKDYTNYAGGLEIEASFNNYELYIFGSELAIRRIESKFREIPLCSYGQIKNEDHPYYGAWYFLKEMDYEGDYHSLDKEEEEIKEWFEVEHIREEATGEENGIVRIIEYRKIEGKSKQIINVIEFNIMKWTFDEILELIKSETENFDKKVDLLKANLTASYEFFYH